MKTVKFKKLKIINFKGIKELIINDLSDDMTISGQNATGKSTIFDAITWCLFGKNSQDKQDFSIKNTVDLSLNRADHVVEIEMFVDDLITPIKRVYREKWTRRRGSEELEFTGNETELFWNNSPVNTREFTAKLNEVMPEQLFKLLTDPLFFNTEKKTPWTTRRDVLIGMAGGVTDEKVINGTPAFQELFAKLQGQKTLIEYAKQIAFEKAGLRKQLADIPARIDELIKSNPKVQDWTAIEKEIADKQAAIAKIDLEIESINFAFEGQMKLVKEQQQAAISASRKMGEIENELTKKAYAEASEANKEITEAKYQVGVVRDQIKSKGQSLSDLEDKIIELNRVPGKLSEEKANLLNEWYAEDAKQFTFDEQTCICPTCKRMFESGDVDAKRAELGTNFRADKDNKLAKISEAGKLKAAAIKQANENITKTNSDIKAVTADILALREKEKSFEWSLTAVPAQPKPVVPQLEKHTQYQALKAESEKVIPFQQPDISEQKEIKASIQEGINELKEFLAGKGQIEKNAIRINELKADEKKYSQELTSLEKQEFTIAAFNKAKMEMIEESVNGRFKIVKFKLFEKQINGGETPCCETMVDNVPFPDLNHAMQINAGIDCANALSDHYGISAPLIIDNSEAINELLPTNSQLIKLEVTRDKELVITNN